MDFKEYTRIRDIVVKRNKRAAAAGLMPLVHFPTVKEIRSGIVDKQQALRALQDYYSSGSQVKAIRQTGNVPDIRQLQQFPKLPERQKQTAEQKLKRKREQQRIYRQKRSIKKDYDKETSTSLLYAYRAVETIQKIWEKAGMNLGVNLYTMTPSEVKAFLEYIDYRFSQGDFTQIYVIDEFVQDFSKLKKKGYSAKQIQIDFDNFLEKRKNLYDRSLSMEGMEEGELRKYWDEFIGD